MAARLTRALGASLVLLAASAASQFVCAQARQAVAFVGVNVIPLDTRAALAPT